MSANVNATQQKPRNFRNHVMANDVTAAMLVCSNLTSVDGDNGSCDEALAMSADDAGGHRFLLLVTVLLYGVICGIGAVGNTVVFVVIALSCVMRSSVTNIYIANLALSDFCFLAGLPLLIVTVLRQVRYNKLFVISIVIIQNSHLFVSFIAQANYYKLTFCNVRCTSKN